MGGSLFGRIPYGRKNLRGRVALSTGIAPEFEPRHPPDSRLSIALPIAACRYRLPPNGPSRLQVGRRVEPWGFLVVPSEVACNRVLGALPAPGLDRADAAHGRPPVSTG